MKQIFFLEFSYVISGSSAFCKSRLYIWNFLVHILLKTSTRDFEHNLVKWVQLCGNLNILWHCFSLGLELKTDLFHSCGHYWVFQLCWHNECSTLMAWSFKILNSSAGTPSPLLALLVVMLPKAHLTSHSRISGFRAVTTALWLSWLLRLFLYNSSVYSCYLFFISSGSVRS